MIVSSIELAVIGQELSKRFRFAGKTTVIELSKAMTQFSDSRFDKFEDCFGRLV